jgi:hypothetical protein
MPGTSSEVKQVLMKWKINTSDWKAALSDITRQITEVRKSDAAARSEDKKYLDYKMKQIRLSVGDLRMEVAEKQKATRELLNQITQQKLISAQASARLMQERAATAEINKQTAAIRNQIAASRAGQGGGGGKGSTGGGGGGFLGGFFGGIGSRFGGTLTSAVAQGELLANVIETLAVKVKRFIEESGPLEQVKEQFEKLAAVKGVDALKFLEDMRAATHNLVSDIQLYRTANMAMQSGIKFNEEQLIALTQATVGLARAQGRDAAQAVNALTRGLTTGRFVQLAYLTGISRTELTVRGLSATMSNHQRIQASFDQALKVITQRYREVGEPAQTFTETLKQLQVVSTRLLESFSRGFVQSSGMKSLFEYFDSIVKKLVSGEGGVEELGKKFGDLLFIVVQGFKALQAVVGSVVDILKDLLNVGVEFGKSFDLSDDFISRMTTFTGLIKTAAQAMVLLRGAFKEVELRSLYELGKLTPNGHFVAGGGIAPIWVPGAKRKTKEQHEAELKAAADEEYNDILALETAFSKATGVATGKGTGTGGKPGDDDSVALQRRMMQLKLQLARDTAKALLDIAKQELQNEKDENEDAYQEGTRSFEDYIARKKMIREKDLIVTMREIQQERDADAANYLERLKSGNLQPPEYKSMMADLAERTKAKVVSAQTQEAKDQSGLDRKVQKDTRDAARLRQEIDLETQREGLQEEEALLEKKMKDGVVTVQAYSDRKKAIWEEELRIFDELEDLKVQGTAQTQARLLQVERTKAKERQLTNKKESLIDQETPELEIDRSIAVFQKQLKVLEAQRAIARVTGGRAGAGTGPSTKAIIDLHQKFIDQQAALMQTVDPTSNSFLKLADSIAASTARIIELRHELPNLPGIFGAGLSGIGGALGSFGAPSSITHYNPGTMMMGQTRVPAVTQLQEGLTKVGAYESEQAKYVTYSRDAGMSSNPIAALGGSFRTLVKSSKDMGTNFDKFSEALTASIGQIGTFVSALQGQGGPVQAGLGGAASGMGLGKGLGDIMSQAGKALGPGGLGSALSAAGPWGAAAGAAIGLVSGIFSGKARKAAEAIAKQITDEINKSLKDYALQNATMAQTIKALQAERAQAVSQLSGKKGGRDQLDKILPQLDQQITQLQEQQKQIMIQMDQNLQVIGSAAPWQPLLQNIQSVIKQYKDYIGAGGDVVKANQFLKDSFANMKVTDTATLNQDMQDAINNALQYNDLLLQRQQYIAQTTQQIEDIMAAGAPSRMRTTAQTKMSQIEQIELERNQRLAEMNEQITVAGYRLTSEQKIFDLAQTRVGLEAQLAQLQMATIDQDVARIAALRDLVNALGGGSLIGTISGAVGGNPTSGTAGLDAVLRLLGLGGGSPGGVAPNARVTNMDELWAAIYRTRGRQGFGGFSGELG